MSGRQSAVTRIMSPLQRDMQSRLNALTSADRDVFDCPICLNKLKENREAPCCNSLFCGACIRGWYAKARLGGALSGAQSGLQSRAQRQQKETAKKRKNK